VWAKIACLMGEGAGADVELRKGAGAMGAPSPVLRAYADQGWDVLADGLGF